MCQFGQLILRKTVTYVATTSYILKAQIAQCTKFDFCWGGQPRLGKLTTFLQTPSWILKVLRLRKETEGELREKSKMDSGRGEMGRKGEEKGKKTKGPIKASFRGKGWRPCGGLYGPPKKIYDFFLFKSYF